ncbi:MAG TPA: hypothetical protein PLA85_05165, partial [Micropepsaceae bacterium]|nr:hypothetical protein [Micropepsaceae bacterium]
ERPCIFLRTRNTGQADRKKQNGKKEIQQFRHAFNHARSTMPEGESAACQTAGSHAMNHAGARINAREGGCGT